MHGQVGRLRRAARFLERAGVLPERAYRTIDRVRVGTSVAAALVAIGTLSAALVGGRLSSWRMPAGVLPAAFVGLGAWALVLAGQWRARSADTPRTGQDTPRPRGLVGALRRARIDKNPWSWGAQIGWSALGLLLEAATLVAALEAVGAGVRVLDAVAVYATLRLLWSLVPVAGAPGAADLTLLLVLTALGAPLASACAAVVTLRLLTFWIPAALGLLLSSAFEHRLLT
jgi:undecaprenyl-diphosphatase